MTPLRELGVALMIVAALMAFARENMKKDSYFRIKGLPQIFDRESYPELFEARSKATAWIAAIALVLGLALLVFQT